MNLLEQLGGIDIYLFDQLLKGQITIDMRILDAGCGSGRNLSYLLRNGYNVYAVDQSAEAIRTVQEMAMRLAPAWLSEQARVEAVEQMSFANDSFDFVINNAVLHFAKNEAHFLQMIHELWRVLKPGGKLFIRLASSIGIESKITLLGDRRYQLPDGSTRFLVDEGLIINTTEMLKGTWFEPLKTVNVAGQRCMSTWCIQKPNAHA
ncbi:class I SAM-dependent methyltransferase [Paenibacillus sp. SYP-B3998]|uniref:Class I SAM-dependent methyltransferase n=1 Tax=Paenibacillus sp. SYP-B3998 TaxID=2678564 RepID=A0A6G3ZYR2_9BACL|nr:class I SAM-dependent methyltransferase [Paenibacillus sp. SYP-B3998]NEW07356.1 class I SAM-dependent methyltransferase [Paenibacillus sp. SYP-B3998]